MKMKIEPFYRLSPRMSPRSLRSKMTFAVVRKKIVHVEIEISGHLIVFS